jgi:hypothetical protein
LYPARAGEVVLLQAPYSFWGKYAANDASRTHGSFDSYDTNVPLILFGKAFEPEFRGETVSEMGKLGLDGLGCVRARGDAGSRRERVELRAAHAENAAAASPSPIRRAS